MGCWFPSPSWQTAAVAAGWLGRIRVWLGKIRPDRGLTRRGGGDHGESSGGEERGRGERRWRGLGIGS